MLINKDMIEETCSTKERILNGGIGYRKLTEFPILTQISSFCVL